MGSILDIFGTSFSQDNITTGNPLYSKSNLSPEQKNAVAIGATWHSMDKNLDKIIAGEVVSDTITVQDAIEGKKLTKVMYCSYRDIYAAYAKL